MRSNRSRLIVPVIFGLALSANARVNADLIDNGGFEAPDVNDFVHVAAGQTTVAPWVVGLVGVDVVDMDLATLNGPAFEGSQYLDLDGTPGPGQITQSFATTPGTRYELSFAVANNWFISSSASATVRVFDGLGDRLSPLSFSHSTSASGDLDWIVLTHTFAAVQSTTDLEFTSLSTGGSGGIPAGWDRCPSRPGTK